MREIIIPSAVLVPRELQRLGELPPIIYPVNEKIVFDFLYKQYKDVEGSICITCYEAADKVHRRLDRYCNDRVRIVELEKLKDLGHTIYESIGDKDIPIIINFADTIVMADIFNQNTDSFYYHEDYVNDQWTYFDDDKGTICRIIDKKSVFSNEKKRLFIGVFQLMHSGDFKDCLRDAFNRTDEEISSFYTALKLYSKRHPMKPIYTDNWFDIGHLDRYYGSSLAVKAREFNHIQIDKERGILKKTSADKEKFIGEILWYLKLPHDIEYVRPRIFQYSTDYGSPYVEMEYYAYHTVHELFLYSDLSISQWQNIFMRIKFICADFSRYKVKDMHIKKALEEMYCKKTKARLYDLKGNGPFTDYFSLPFVVNGVKYMPLEKIIVILESMITQSLYDVEEFCIIHGDLCFANILVDSNYNFIKVIDPRGKFGHFDIYGDQRYEIAKLFHSIDGKYDFIIKDLFDLNVDMRNMEIEYKVQDRIMGFDLFDVFMSVFEDIIGCTKEKIELIEALLFLSMIPLHKESLQHQFAMLATGITILDRIADIRDDF